MSLTTQSTGTVINRLSTASADFRPTLERLLSWEPTEDRDVEATVRDIIQDVRTRGASAVVELTNRFDRRDAVDLGALTIHDEELQSAWQAIGPELRAALQAAHDRIHEFHQRQVQQSWSYVDATGTRLGQILQPVERVGLYVPGGKAAYPSSVLMNAVPAIVAGVEELIVTVPAPGGEMNPAVLAALALVNPSQVFSIGGAQAVAALAYGCGPIPRVDKIVGPGNAYVATAKRQVFGQVGIDMVAGPSEILIVSDGTLAPRWAVADLFSQAEHDEDARAVLIAPDEAYLDAVEDAIREMLPGMERAETIAASLAQHGALIKCADLDEAIALSNEIAPEHLELAVRDPNRLLESVKHAGAVFLGQYASEVLGDYCAGPNHVLPTGRTARFSSALGVYDFQKRTSIIECDAGASRLLGEIAASLADAEGLSAHALSARIRSSN